jgi:RHS repeat-associated protein
MKQRISHTKPTTNSYAAAYGYKYRYDGFGGSAQASHGVSPRHTAPEPGSSAWITDGSGNACTEQSRNVNQYLAYMPFGESYIDQRTNHDIRFKFTTKEEGSETGYQYFGARYLPAGKVGYASDLSVWLSVDPLASKYPSISPYVYCAGNPVMLVDIDGCEIIIHGDDSEGAFFELKKATSLTLKMDENGKLSTTITDKNIPISKLDKALLEAINNPDVIVNLYTTDAEVYDSKDGGKRIPILVGAYEGSEIINGKIETTQLFNLGQAKKLEASGMSSISIDITHEIMESYYGGLNDPGGDYLSGFKKAHKLALAIDPCASSLVSYINLFTNARGLADGNGHFIDLVPVNTTKKFIKPSSTKNIGIDSFLPKQKLILGSEGI